MTIACSNLPGRALEGQPPLVSCLLMLAVFIVGATGCNQPKPQTSSPAAVVAEVVVTNPRAVKLPEYLEVTGRIDAERVVDIRSRVTGYLTKVHFQDGQFV
ncbi:MAG: hypothetical protein EBU59_12250, partial [Planctomycetia bacterium]|nr:hypothetical protein [Planctomycetia bacterium]